MKSQLHSGVVWIIAGLALCAYGVIGLTQTDIFGVENLVNFIQSAEGNMIYLAAFVAILFEGMYVVGSVIPGTSFVLIATIMSFSGGMVKYVGVIFSIYLGWLLAGVFNVYAAKLLSAKLPKPKAYKKIESNAEATWFPAFRANTEVSQTIEGHPHKEVLWESLKIKTYTCLGLSIYALIVPLIVDFNDMSNEEGFKSLAILALINIGVGGYKIHQYRQEKSGS